MKYKLGNLLMEYSEKVFTQLIKLYKSQNHNLDEDNIRYYINRFDQLKSAIQQRFAQGDEAIKLAIPKELQEKNRFLDILQWKRFRDLEHIIDLFPAAKSVQKAAQEKAVNDISTDADEMYNKDGIEIYKGDTQHRCVKYGENEKYSWCISRAGETRSMYNNYRFQEGGSRMFYFVFDRNRSSRKTGNGFEDEWHAFVVHVFEKGSYAVTTAPNNGDKTAATWDDLGKVIPSNIWSKIKGLKSIFEFIPPSQEETELRALKGNRLTKEQFLQLSHRVKVMYVQNNAQELSTEIFKVCDGELKNLAINYGRRCSYEELKSNTGLLKRYPDYMATREPEKPIPYEFIPYLKEDLQREYYDKWEKECLTFDEIEKYFSKNILHEYITKQIELLGFLPEEAEKYMDETQRRLFDVYSIPYKDVIYFENYSNSQNNIAPKRFAQLNSLSVQTFNSLEPKQQKEFIALIKKVGANIKNVDKFNPPGEGGIFTGIPVSFILSGKLFMIMPQTKESDETFDLVDETGKVIVKNIKKAVFMKGGKAIPENQNLSKQTGSSTYYLTERDFDTLNINDKAYTQSQLLGSLKESEDMSFKFKRLAGILK